MLAGQTARNSAKIISIGNRYIFFISVCFRLKCSLSTVFHCESQTKHSPLFSCITSTKNIKIALRSISTLSTYLHYLQYLHLPRIRADPSAGRAAAQQEGGRHQRGLRHQMRQGLQVSLTLRRLRGSYQFINQFIYCLFPAARASTWTTTATSASPSPPAPRTTCSTSASAPASLSSRPSVCGVRGTFVVSFLFFYLYRIKTF